MTPATTIQMLGAERALFRHLRNKNIPPPKHGHIINHPLLAKAASKDKGKVARALADKICIASRIDYFKGEFLGDKLRKDLEDKFRQ
jgi:nucleolar protein 56